MRQRGTHKQKQAQKRHQRGSESRSRKTASPSAATMNDTPHETSRAPRRPGTNTASPYPMMTTIAIPIRQTTMRATPRQDGIASKQHPPPQDEPPRDEKTRRPRHHETIQRDAKTQTLEERDDLRDAPSKTHDETHATATKSTRERQGNGERHDEMNPARINAIET